jgi:hypothetical protein
MFDEINFLYVVLFCKPGRDKSLYKSGFSSNLHNKYMYIIFMLYNILNTHHPVTCLNTGCILVNNDKRFGCCLLLLLLLYLIKGIFNKMSA